VLQRVDHPAATSIGQGRGHLNSRLEVRVRRGIFLVVGVLLAIVGIVFTLQGLNVLGQSGGMNGHSIYAVIGVIVVLGGLGLVTIAIRAKPSA
jgi:hypothetical protein